MNKTLPICLGLLLLSTSCAHRMVGHWNVDRYETQESGQQGVALMNIGTMNFKKDGTGDKNLNYTVLGARIDDSTPFVWTWGDDKFIAIESSQSDLSKSWIIMENKSKYQKWKSTDGSTNIQILELTKTKK